MTTKNATKNNKSHIATNINETRQPTTNNNKHTSYYTYCYDYK